MTDWIEYTVEDCDEYVPIEKWGKDHWSTFAYLETVAVDCSGMITNERMRCNSRLHREFANVVLGELKCAKGYPTILADGKLEDHDDWSCLEDMVAAGLIKAYWQEVYRIPQTVFGNCRAKVEFTETGWAMAGELREHKSTNGTFVSFRC